MQRVIQKVAWLVQHQQITQVYRFLKHNSKLTRTLLHVSNDCFCSCHGNICQLFIAYGNNGASCHIARFSLKFTLVGIV